MGGGQTGRGELELILHVEDADADAEVVQHLLQHTTYTLRRARTYGEMLEFRGNPDVILLDLRIPGSNDPMRLVRDTVRRHRSAAIILLTDIGDDEIDDYVVAAIKLGVQSRLLKRTVDSKRLILAIREAYERKQHMRRQIEESRSDMRTDPTVLRDVFETMMSQVAEDNKNQIEDLEAKLLRRLKKLGAGDTQPHDPVFDSSDSKSKGISIEDYEKRWQSWPHALMGFVKDHPQATAIAKWIVYAAVAAYVAAGDYVKGIHKAIHDTNARVKVIEQTLDSKHEHEK